VNQPATPMNPEKIKDQIAKGAQNNALSNDDLVQIIELCGAFLNLQTIANYARAEGISYNGVKNNRAVHKLFGVKFVIDND